MFLILVYFGIYFFVRIKLFKVFKNPVDQIFFLYQNIK